MTLLHDAVNEKKYDVRVAQRNVDRGVMTAQDYEKTLKALPDDSDNVTWLNIETLKEESGQEND